MSKLLFCCLFISLQFVAISQFDLKGVVSEPDGTPIFAANAYCQSQMEQNTVTDFSGRYALTITDCDTVCFSYLGFEKECVPILKLKALNGNIVLTPMSNIIDAIEIIASDPISTKFSAVKLEKLEIYQNPLASGDPLKAITLLPSSTNADESANPILRGSSADRSRVVVNSVPIRSPVRNGQLNGIGNFSLFNTEILSKLYVYASNPPLTYGNSTGGLVEIETLNSLDANQWQISTSLANVGLFVSQKFGKKNFIQAYSNYQFSDGFVGLNRSNLPNLRDFGSNDAGLIMRVYTGKKSYWNTYNYFIDEGFEFNTRYFNYEGTSTAGKVRFFTINNWRRQFESGYLQINNLLDYSDQFFNFGNLTSNLKTGNIFTSVDYKHFLNDRFTLQGGAQLTNTRYSFDNQFSEYLFSVADNIPTFKQDSVLTNNPTEGYLYCNWELNDKWNLSSGLRSNILKDRVSYLSSQFAVNFQPSPKHRLLLSAGRYNNFSTPNFTLQSIDLLTSYQAALDYDYKIEGFNLLAAVYYKLESGQFQDSEMMIFNEVESVGLELLVRKSFAKHFEITFANTFIDQKIATDDGNFRSSSDFDYFFKASLQFNNEDYFNAALSYIGRPGQYFTPVSGRTFNPTIDIYEPIFSEDLNSAQFNGYNTLNFSINRYFPLGDKAIICFVSINNILNRKNQQSATYNAEITETIYQYFQMRSIYFGAVIQINK